MMTHRKKPKVSVRVITVAEFRLFSADQISMVTAQRNMVNGRPHYSVVMRLRLRDEEYLLVSHHGHVPRTWASLDRMLTFLERENIVLTEMVIKFN